MEPLFVVRASTHLNFAPGTTTPMPPGENHHVESEPLTASEAATELVRWQEVCEDRWRVRIEPATAKATREGEARA